MSGENPIWALITTFGLMSLFAVGGAAAAVPEMHRIAVDVHHWMTDKQFADATKVSNFDPGVGLGYVAFLQRRGSSARAEDVLTELAGRQPNNVRVLTALANVRLQFHVLDRMHLDRNQFFVDEFPHRVFQHL